MAILLVEDDSDCLDLLDLILKEEGFETICCKSGSEAIGILKERLDINLVLLDLMMPEMDGYDVLRSMNEEPDILEIPVIVVSALGDPDSISKAFYLGAFEYIVKPFDALSLTARVKSSMKFSKASKELRERNKSLVHLIKESNSQRKTLEANLEYLEDLIDVIDHKIKNTIVPILSYSEIFKENASGEMERKVFSNIYTSINSLNLTVDELLHGLRNWSERKGSNISEVEMAILLDNIRLFFHNSLADKGIELNINIADHVPVMINTDLTLLMEIIDNLVSNAIKYTEKSGRIDIDLEMVGGELKISVCDTGIGISDEEIERIFERNYIVRSDDLDPKMNRTGVGLFLVKKFTESLGGRIEVESKLGSGSKFQVYLPLSE